MEQKRSAGIKGHGRRLPINKVGMHRVGVHASANPYSTDLEQLPKKPLDFMIAKFPIEFLLQLMHRKLRKFHRFQGLKEHARLLLAPAPVGQYAREIVGYLANKVLFRVILNSLNSFRLTYLTGVRMHLLNMLKQGYDIAREESCVRQEVVWKGPVWALPNISAEVNIAERLYFWMKGLNFGIH